MSEVMRILQMYAFQLELMFALAVYAIPLRGRRYLMLRAVGWSGVMLFGGRLWLGTLPGVQMFLSKPGAGVLGDHTAMFALTPGSIGFCFLYGLIYSALFVLMFLGVWFCFCVTAREAALCASLAYATEHIAYCIRLMVNATTGAPIADSGTWLHLLIHGAVYLAAYFFFARRMVEHHHYETDAVSSLRMTLVTLFIVLFMSMAANVYGYAALHGVYGLACCLFILINQRNQIQQWNLRQEMSRREQLWMANRAQYELSRENIELINRKCHDLKHQIGALRTMENSRERERLVDSIQQSVMIYDSIMRTGNPILDTVLTEKSLLCSEHHIAMNGMVDGRLLDFMDGVDLYTLFGNALDNAIEGNFKVEEERRCISLRVHEKVNLIFIQIENPYRGQLQFSHGLPLTDKPDKDYHGYGVRSIRDMAEKYGGFITIETEQDMFLLRVAIPAKERQSTGTEGA